MMPIADGAKPSKQVTSDFIDLVERTFFKESNGQSVSNLNMKSSLNPDPNQQTFNRNERKISASFKEPSDPLYEQLLIEL